MSSKARISKENIISTTFSIAQKEGLENISARIIAKKLNCSVQPIYYQFKNIEELKIALVKKIEEYFYEYLTSNIDNKIPSYKQTGLNYIKFAQTEPNLFKILYMSKTNLSPESFISSNEGNFQKYIAIIKKCTNLSDSDLKNFHLKMWIFTHGLATLIATGTCSLTEYQISDLLTQEFNSLMLLEEKKEQPK